MFERIKMLLTTTKKTIKTRSKKGGKRLRQPRQRSGVMYKGITGNFASRMEQFSIACTAGVVYDFSFNLQDLPASTVLAQLYQYYRITSVELRFKPNTDTYISNGAGGSSTGFLPYLYFQYDKSGALAGTMNAANFEQLGTKAVRMDDKTIVRKWKPSVLTVNDGALGISQFKVSPWLPTHEYLQDQLNQPLHFGSTFYISKTNAADTQVYDVDVVVNIQLRKPFVPPAGEGVRTNPPRMIQGNVSGHIASTPVQGPSGA